jgi:CMP-N-acetylneuraminic acid synthetase
LSAKIIAIIPARGGSKGLPRKNILPLAGEPLIAHTIKPALNCSFISKVVVSTDNKEIAEVAHQFGAAVIERPSGLAGDASPSHELVTHVAVGVEHIEIFNWTSSKVPSKSEAFLLTTQLRF